MKSAFKKWELYEKTHKKVKKKRYLAKTSFILIDKGDMSY